MIIEVKTNTSETYINAFKIVKVIWNYRENISYILMDDGTKIESTDKPAVISKKVWESYQHIANAVSFAFPNIAGPDPIEVGLSGRVKVEPYVPEPS